MDQIVTMALVGTARQGQVRPVTGTPVDTLMEELQDGENERKLLLSAGARAIYKQAGQQARQMVSRPEPAGPETLLSCPLKIEQLLSQLLSGEHEALLPDALRRLRTVGMHLPYPLLPRALDKSDRQVRAELFPVLGERGIWLSRYKASWNWVQDFLPTAGSGLPAGAETIWQEGTTAQRRVVLARLRASDPDKAREWLQDVWPRERADVRGDFLTTLTLGLSKADEAFLDTLLDDRAASVRSIAFDLLAAVPDSAFVARMVARGREMVQLQKDGTLKVKPPQDLETSWLHDGILRESPERIGKRAWWLIQVLSYIPPTFWETYLGQEPASLLELAMQDRWGINLLDGWSRATIKYQASPWVLPLWRWWTAHFKPDDTRLVSDRNVRQSLLLSLPAQAMEEAFLDLYFQHTGWPETLAREAFTFLPPEPWSETFSLALLSLLRSYCLDPKLDFEKVDPYYDPHFTFLGRIAYALPQACLDQALLSPWERPTGENHWKTEYANRYMRTFVDIIQMRKKIEEEIV